MDPALREMLRRNGPGEIEAILRLVAPNAEIPGVRTVARFGDVVTCRLPAEQVERVHADPRCVSLKASRAVGPEPEPEDTGPVPTGLLSTDVRRPQEMPYTGAGVVLAVLDWDCAFTHPSFLRRPQKSGEAPTTRLLSLWDQRGGRTTLSPRPYGYGRLFPTALIDAALRRPDPYAALAYHPHTSGHGTHVLDIAAGSGPDGPSGVAPGTDLVFVHLAGLSSLGDSVRILEAVDLVGRVARGRDLVVNVSAGRIGGPHNGCTLVERALDHLLQTTSGRCVVQSGGNYGDRFIHVEGQVGTGETLTVSMCTHPDDTTPNEVELWYTGADTFAVRVGSPTGQLTSWILPGHRQKVPIGNVVAGVLYHRRNEPNSGDNHVDLFLEPWAPAGAWTIQVHGVRVRNGKFHAWIERDEACPRCQAIFTDDRVSPQVTIGTIANSRLPVIVGGCDGHRPDHPITSFSSRGPTRDGRCKPDLVAPALNVLAARARKGWERKSGTSMASPFVAGAVALCLEAAPGIPVTRIRELLRAAAVPVPGEPADLGRQGAGYLDLTKLAATLQTLGGPRPQGKSTTMESPDELYERFLAGAAETAGYIVVALPGERPRDRPAPGDRLIRILFGWPGQGRGATLTGEPVLNVSGSASEPWGPGYYASVNHDGPDEPATRRILDHRCRMPSGQLLLRPVTQLSQITPLQQTTEESAENGRTAAASGHGAAALTAANLVTPQAAITRHSFTGAEIRAAALAGMALKPTGRLAAMAAITPLFGIPDGGFHGQSVIVERGDVRLVGLLRPLTDANRAQATADNLNRAGRLLPGIRPALVAVTASREHGPSLWARGLTPLNTYDRGGLDFLWANRQSLGLPASVIRQWRSGGHFVNPETGELVRPGLIPARDQVLGYAAQIRSSYARFVYHIRQSLGGADGDAALRRLGAEAELVWQAYAFLAPGGNPFQPTAGLRLGRKAKQRFGVRSALGYMQNRAQQEGRPIDLNEIVSDRALHGLEWVRSAKHRAAETMFLESLLRRAGIP